MVEKLALQTDALLTEGQCTQVRSGWRCDRVCGLRGARTPARATTRRVVRRFDLPLLQRGLFQSGIVARAVVF